MSHCHHPVVFLFTCLALAPTAAADIVVGSKVPSCAEDAGCINRLHSDIPMAASADPGERITFIGRDASDIHLDPVRDAALSVSPREQFGAVHPLTGPVHINGAKEGDVIAVRIEKIEPDNVGYTSASSFGFAGDAVGAKDRFIVIAQADSKGDRP